MSEEAPQKPPKKKRNPFHRKPVPPLKKRVVSLQDVDVRQLPRQGSEGPAVEAVPLWAAEDMEKAAEQEAAESSHRQPEPSTAEQRPRVDASQVYARRLEPRVARSSPDVGLLTVREVADRLGITPHALRERMRRRGVPVTKIGYMSLIARSDVERLK